MTRFDSLDRNADLDTWIRVEPRERITVFTGKAELGQGLTTAIARIAAEELEVAVTRIVVHTADTEEGPDEFLTAGSRSMADSGAAVRQAAAHARTHLVGLASAELSAASGTLAVEDGTILAPDGRSVTYWELLGGKRFGVPVDRGVSPRNPGEYRVIGRPGPRVDLPGIVTGATRFVQDLMPEGVCHGRVVRPPGGEGTLVSLRERAALDIAGVVKVVRDGSFLAVVAEDEYAAVLARERLSATTRWTMPTPRDGRVRDWLPAQPSTSLRVVDGRPIRASVVEMAPPADAALTLEASYSRPYLLHASIAPSAALALWADGRLTVWTHSQGVHVLRTALAEAFAMHGDQIRVIHVPGPGCYGHNGADDVAFDAALAARAVDGRPLLLKWTREDEHGASPRGAPSVTRIRASVDGDGTICDWSQDVWGLTHNSRPPPSGGSTGLLGAWSKERPLPRLKATPATRPHGGIHRNADPLYVTGRRRIVKHFVHPSGPRTSSIRSLGAHLNVFAIESMMDALAYAVERDPLQFRLSHLHDARARDVLAAAALRGGWSRREQGSGRGTGLGFAQYENAQCYAAVLVTLTVDDASAQITLERAVIAADAGQVIDPEGLTNQLEGGFIQAASWTIKEEARYVHGEPAHRDWNEYPILTFAEVPEIETVLLNRPGEPYLGAGEAVTGPTAAAIGNAVFHAVGIRVRHLPMTPASLREAAADMHD